MIHSVVYVQCVLSSSIFSCINSKWCIRRTEVLRMKKGHENKNAKEINNSTLRGEVGRLETPASVSFPFLIEAPNSTKRSLVHGHLKAA